MAAKQAIIVGAGAAALVAAIDLEKAGWQCLLIDKNKHVGGRLQTEEIDGWPLDRGFQVLLTAYPLARRYLDYAALELQTFLPGAVIRKQERDYRFGDPLRHPAFLAATLLPGVGSYADKLRLAYLQRQVQSREPARLFSGSEESTSAFLQRYGFSRSLQRDFFAPFFGGVFLERDLATPADMFRFVYAMFSRGYAAWPRQGMQAIATQLAERLQHSEIILQKEVVALAPGRAILRDGSELSANVVIDASDGQRLTRKADEQLTWRRVDNIYLRVRQGGFGQPLIGLLPDSKYICNYHFINDLRSGHGSVLSVSVPGHLAIAEGALVAAVQSEVEQRLALEVIDVLAHYRIDRALPVRTRLQYAPSPAQTRLEEGLYTCGDGLANASLNAAMASGAAVAKQVQSDMD
jgi:phytoene dehydrogenase-like protein